MEYVLELFSHPVSWVIAVIMALLAGVAALYLARLIDVALAAISKSYRARKELRDKHRRELISELSNNPTLLVLQSIENVMGTIQTTFGMVMFLLALTFIIQLRDRGDERGAQIAVLILVLLVMLFIPPIVYGYISAVRTLSKAKRRYRQNCRQPEGKSHTHDKS
jgi:multisubunit Na+/H+ antiporter MnhG subunit